MSSVQTLYTAAKQARGDHALELYSDAFNMLIAQSAAFARTATGNVTDEGELRTLTPLLIQYSREYLKRDLMAATILNAMGMAFDAVGDFDNAKQKFTEAIDYTPDHITYDEPHHNLEEVSSRIIKTAELEPSDE